MESDSEGFKRPVINSDICNKCKKCINHCPVQSAPLINEQTKAFYIRTKQEDDLMRSTSGGAFSLLAKHILNKDGVVYGVAFDTEMKVVHIRISDTDGLKAIMRSKYVQSDISNCFSSVKKDLDDGLFVLFSGTPCQVAAIKKYLNHDYDNLYLVDIICHGVPSPKVWAEYIKEIETHYGDKVVDVFFRDKQHGYASPYFLIKFQKRNSVSMPIGDSPYFRGFLINLFVRQSCHDCRFKGTNRCSDLTLADFYGIEKCVSNYEDDDKGVSLVLVHSNKGSRFLDVATENACNVAVDLNKAIEKNSMCLKSATSSKDRTLFFKENIEVSRFYRKHYKHILLINMIKHTRVGMKLYKIVKK